MATFAIDINDAELVVAGPAGVVATEPGYAVVTRDGIVTGIEAYAQARLKPRQSSHRFWSELSVDASSGVGGAHNAAELAFAQLQALWRGIERDADDVVLVVPSYYRGEQLGLLLGLAEECRMPVRAMIDAAAAVSTQPHPGRELVYVDAGLHRVYAVPVGQGEDASAGVEQALEGTGLAGLRDALAKRLAELYVLATRFDPLHRAETEQALYDSLDESLEAVTEREQTELSLPHDGQRIALEVTREQWLGVAAGFYKAVLQLIAQTRSPGAPLVVQLSERLARLPGLATELRRLDAAEIVSLPAGHAAVAVLMNAQALPPRGDQVKLLRHFAWRAEPAKSAAVAGAAPTGAASGTSGATAASSTQPAHSGATHVVYRGVVYAVDGGGLVVGRDRADGRRGIVVDDQTGGVSRSHCELVLRDGELRLRDLSSYGTFVNERRVAGEESLRPADVIRIGSPGAELTVVTMEVPAHG